MKSPLAALLLAGCLLLPACACTGGGEGEGDEGNDEVALATGDLPTAVREAAMAAVPGMVIEEGAREVEDGRTFYEAAGSVDGAHVDVVCTEIGGLVAVERVVALDAVPAAVRAAALAKLPGLEITRAEKIHYGGAHPEGRRGTYYELKGKADGKTREILLTEAGDVVEVE